MKAFREVCVFSGQSCLSVVVCIGGVAFLKEGFTLPPFKPLTPALLYFLGLGL